MTFPVSFLDLVEAQYKTDEAILKAELIEKFLITKIDIADLIFQILK